MASVAKPYVRALFELSIENGNLDALYHEALEIQGIFHSDDQLRKMLNSPCIQKEKKAALLNRIFSGFNNSLTNLMGIMIKKGRGTHIETVITGFIELAKEHKGVIGVHVVSAVALTDEQLTALKSKLSLCMNKQAEIEASVDPSLIGGLLIKAGGYIYDSTIKKHLQLLKKRMAKQVKETYG